MSLGFFVSPKQFGRRWSTRLRRPLRAIFCIACGLVGVLSLLPSAVLPPVSIGDKAEHVVTYALLGLLGCVLFERRAVAVILKLAAYGFLLELLQTFSSGRSPEVADGIADFIGACLGGGAAIVLRRTLVVVDKIAGGATQCRACSVGGDAPRTRHAQPARRVSPV